MAIDLRANKTGAATAAPRQRAEGWAGFAANRGALAGLVVLALMGLGALLASVLAAHDPVTQYRDAMLQPPAWQAQGSARFVLGTDELGRDLLARLLHGARLSLGIAAGGVALSLLPGVLLGLTAAAYPRWWGQAVLRSMDVLMALPALLLALAVVAVLGPGLVDTVLAIAVVGLPGYVRLVRAAAAAELRCDYVTAARVIGVKPLRLMWRTVLPNCMAPLIVNATLHFSDALLTVAALGFLGLGVQPPAPEWGTLLAGARDAIERAPWLVTWPGLAILATALAINLVGDGLRDALDPRLRSG